MLRKIFNRAVQLAGDPQKNRTADVVLLGMAIANKFNARQPAQGHPAPQESYDDATPALYTTNLKPVADDAIGFNPVICFASAGGFRNTNVYTNTGIYVRDLIAHNIATIIADHKAAKPDSAVPAKESANLTTIKQALKARMEHPALRAHDVSDLDMLPPAALDAVGGLLAAQDRIVCYAYSPQSPAEQTQEENFRANPAYACAEAHSFVEKTFMPRLTRSGENGAPVLLSPQELRKNLRMTMVGYSYGGLFIAQTLNALDQKMTALGYDRATIDQSLSNIHVHNMQGSNGLTHRHATSNVTLHDKNDLMTLSSVSYGGYYPWRLMMKAERLAPDNRDTVINGPNSALVWAELPMPETIPQQIRNDIAAGTAPKALAYHFSTIEQPEKLPADARNALLASLFEERQMPPIAQSVHYDIYDHKPQRSYGTDRNGFPVHLDEIIEATQASTAAQDTIAAYLRDHETVKLNKAVGDLAKSMVTDLKETAGIDISRKAANSAAQIILIRAKEEAAPARQSHLAAPAP